MVKKRISLSNIIEQTIVKQPEDKERYVNEARTSSKRPTVKQQTAYLPLVVYEQLRILAFEERRKMHDYLLEGLDLVFKERGLPSIKEILR
jgi:hypothetical protein